MSRIVVVAFVGVIVGGTVFSLGQTTQPATRPGNQSAEEMLRQMLQPQGEAAQPLKPIAPADQPQVDNTGGVAAVAPGAPSPPLVREGTPLLDRVGRLTPIAQGQMLEFTLESDGSGMTEPPLVLLPNRKLMQLEDRVKTSYRDLKISISGEVTEYRGRNYLLLSRWSVVQDVAQPLR
jgi:hypothetical protein